MLLLKHIYVQFQNKIIFDNASFQAFPQQLTVIIGESGIGKTTLIQTMLFGHKCQYFLDDKDYSKISAREQSQFIASYMSVVFQEPIFINDLTIEEHIHFIMQIYQLTDASEDIMIKLGIESLLYKYPLQLSGGEKTRVAIYLAILKNPYILILDEPTASLDKNNKKIVIEFLKEYAKSNHMVIVVSHDEELTQNADKIYKIENKKINCIKNCSNKKEGIAKTSCLYGIQKYYVWFKKMNKHYFVLHKFILFLLGFTIASVFISLSLNNVIIKQTKKYLNDFSSNELLIYQPIFEGDPYSFEGYEFPIDSSLVNQLNQIDEIDRICWRWDLPLTDVTYFYSGEYGEEKMAYSTVTSFNGQQKLKSSDFKNDLWFHTYFDNVDYSEKIDVRYHDEGIYISSQLYKTLFDDQSVTEPYLSFELPVPIYNSSGISVIYNQENNDDSSPSNTVTSKSVNVRLPVKGVIKGSVLSQEDDSFVNHIYLSQGYMESMIEQHRSHNDRVIYSSFETFKTYVNEKPNDYSVENYQTVYQAIWQPNSYSVMIKDITQMEEVLKKIKELGFAIESQYFEASTLLLVNEKTQTTAITISCMILLVVLSVYLIMQYLRFDHIKNTSDFLKYQGFSTKEINQFHSRMNMYNTLSLFVCSLLWYFLMRVVLEKMMIAYIQIDLLIIIGMFLFIVIIEYVYKQILVRIKK